MAYASTCSEVVVHIHLARASFEEAETYQQEDNNDMALVGFKNAHHELGMARVGSDEGKGPVQCLSDSAYLDYNALDLEDQYYQWRYVNSTELPASELLFQLKEEDQFMAGGAIKRSSNPRAFDTAKKWLKSLHSLYKTMLQVEKDTSQ